MAIYCIGDVDAKRTAFRKEQKEKICLDNDEVLTTTLNNGKTYFMIGKIPFSNMKVSQYVCYQRALLCGGATRESEIKYYAKLFGFSLSLKSKMKKLDVMRYRMAQTLAKISLPIKEIYVVLDGYEYSKSRRKKLKKFLKKLDEYFKVHVSVSDYRFIPYGSAVVGYNKDGSTYELNQSLYVCSRCKKRKTTKRFSVTSENAKKIKKITVTNA